MKIYNAGELDDDIKNILWYHQNGGNNYIFSRLVGINIFEGKKKISIVPLYNPLINIMWYKNGIIGLELLGKYLFVFMPRKPWVVFQKSEQSIWRKA